MSKAEAITQNIKQEMRRGTLVLAVLTQLDHPQYGYSLIQLLNEQGIIVEQNTLYPLLRRIEEQGLLVSEWTVEENRPRRYYKISNLGVFVRTELINEWKQLQGKMVNIIGGVS